MASNWLKATAIKARDTEETLVCPKCQAMNRPGAIIIQLDARTWSANCGCCAHDFIVEPPGH